LRDALCVDRFLGIDPDRLAKLKRIPIEKLFELETQSFGVAHGIQMAWMAFARKKAGLRRRGAAHTRDLEECVIRVPQPIRWGPGLRARATRTPMGNQDSGPRGATGGDEGVIAVAAQPGPVV